MTFDWLGLIFPRRCPICHEVVEEKGHLACDICRTRLTYVRDPFCMKCGKPLLAGEDEYCADCQRKKHQFQKGRAAFVYDGIMSESIARFKYKGRREYAAFYAEEICRKCEKEVRLWDARVLIPIPLHRSRRKERGFNQSELLAKELSTRLGIPMDTTFLKRSKKTKAQKELDDRERLANLKGAFSVTKKQHPYRRVILVDDIYTTGSTLDAAAAVLKENGVQTVYFLSICVGRGC